MQAKKHLGPKLIQRAAESGIEVRPVHVGRPLEEQGPFDILLHKVRRKGEHANFFDQCDTSTLLGCITECEVT